MHYHQNPYVRNVTGLHRNYEHKRQIKAIRLFYKIKAIRLENDLITTSFIAITLKVSNRFNLGHFRFFAVRSMGS